MESIADQNIKPPYDQVFQDIAHYIKAVDIESPAAYEMASLCLMDALGCAMLALNFEACTKLLGPIVPGASLEGGARVPGTTYELEPIQAAFNIGTMIRWLDFNDTWLAAEWGHPSDNLGAILSLADYLSRKNLREGQAPLLMRDVLSALIKAYEIQGCFALENAFNRRGLDHVVLVKLASAAAALTLLKADDDSILSALSQVFVDGQALRTYRHAPNTGSRKSWAAGDASARALRLVFLTLAGEKGYPSALTAKGWGFYDTTFAGESFKFQRPYGSYVIENILFKLSNPAEFHAQTAVECALALHQDLGNRLEDIERIELLTQSAALRIITKEGPLHNPADRDHCLQYMVAVALLYGDLQAFHYEDETAADSRIDSLRSKMLVFENPQFSLDYLDPTKRSIPNTVRLVFSDGSVLEKTVEYPIGHGRRREEGKPVLIEKFKKNLQGRFELSKINALAAQLLDSEVLMKMPVTDFMASWCTL